MDTVALFHISFIWIIVAFNLFKNAYCQQLSEPAILEACGQDVCARKGFYHCARADNGVESCWECQKYLDHLCGTLKQPNGCNLYCQHKLNQTYEEHLGQLRNESDVYKVEISHLKSKVTELEGRLAVTVPSKDNEHSKPEGTDYRKDVIALAILAAGFFIVSLALGCLYLRLRCHMRIPTATKEELNSLDGENNPDDTEYYRANRLQNVNPQNDRDEGERVLAIN